MYGPAPRRGPQTASEWVILSVFLLFFLTVFAIGIFAEFRPANLAVILVLVFWVPLLAVHEFAHAAVAALLGWRVSRVVVGLGPPIARFRAGTAAVEVRLLPLEGFIRCVPTRLRMPQLKSALIYFAGPGAELLIAAGVVLLAGSDELFGPSEEYWVVVWRSLFLAAASQAVLNLLPFPVATRDGVLHSDGLGIIASLFRPTSHYARMIGVADNIKPSKFTAMRPAGNEAIDRRTETATPVNPDWVEATCEECGRTSRFAAWKLGTVQACPQCYASMDVGPAEDDGEWRQRGGEDQR